MTERSTHFSLYLTSALVAFILATSYASQSAREESSSDRRAELASLVSARQERSDSLQRELKGLRDRVDAAGRASGRAALESLRSDVARIALLAGETAVRGNGLLVTVADGPLAGRDQSSADFQIQDVDVQQIVNALWDGGAEAIAINGQRIVSTTAVRSAGGTILVNYRVLTSPYVIAAIGDSGTLDRSFSDSATARRFREWVGSYHLGFSVKRARGILLPAFGGSIRFRYAQPMR